MKNLKKPKAKPLFDAHDFLTKSLDAYTLDLNTRSDASMFHNFARDRWTSDFKKKFLISDDRMTRESLAFAKFRQVNDEMAVINHSLFEGITDADHMILECAKHLIYHVLGDVPQYEDIFLHCKNSGGSSVGVPFWDTSPERKFRYPVSITQSCVSLQELYIEWDHDLAHAIKALNERDGNNSPSLVFVRGSRGCTVPKTDSIDRFIGSEPVWNMFFQHGINSILEDRLKQVGLSFDKDPELHRRWACWGSIHNGLATIDFSSMSDRISLGICQYLLPRRWYDLLLRVRSPEVLIQNEWVTLNMISTMGNATTFPLETLILWAIGVSTVQNHHSRYKKIPVLARGKKSKISPYADCVSVFGDDCILERRYVPSFLDACVAAGFSPNPTKTFFGDEYFRESCGGDFFHGRDVRPFYLGALPEVQSNIQIEAYLYSTINGVIRKYISYFGTVEYLFDKHLLRYLFSCLKSVTNQVKFVPENFPEDSGITSLSDIRRFQQCYRGLSTSEVSVSKNGMLSFSYLRYLYKEKLDTDDQLRYALCLKGMMRGAQVYVSTNEMFPDTQKKSPVVRSLRKRGKYVQAKSKGVVSLTTPTTLLNREYRK